MKLVFAPDSFKGTLTATEVSELLTKAAKEVFGGCDIISLPVADGGEGTTDAVVAALGGSKVPVLVRDPLMNEHKAYFGRINENTAIMEMAQASGLTLVPENFRNPIVTTTFGTGELLKAILDEGYSEIYISIGGSATNDGGMGFLSALGIRFYDKDGGILSGKGSSLENISRIDTSEMDGRLSKVKITVLCDVNNPLCGENGATYTFGMQKGGTPAILERLEKGMQNYRNVLIRDMGVNPDNIPGSGAAGGLGAALAIFLKAEMKPGIETMLSVTGFDEKIIGADLIITGEGRSDKQSAYGKVVCGVGEHAKKAGIPAVALCGRLGEGYEELYNHGINSFITAVDHPMTEQEAFANAHGLVYKAAIRLFRLYKVNMEK